jgi:hypothetical protein
MLQRWLFQAIQYMSARSSVYSVFAVDAVMVVTIQGKRSRTRAMQSLSSRHVHVGVLYLLYLQGRLG